MAPLYGAAQTALLFDGVPGFAYVVKDAQGRYIACNQSVLQRVKARSVEELRGRTANEIWPKYMGDRYEEQDRWLIMRDLPILYQLDPTVFPNGDVGWCVTHKYPLRAQNGAVIGILCLSRDLPETARNGLVNEALAAAVDRMVIEFDKKLQIAELAEQAGMTTATFAARIRKIYGICPVDFILRSRVRAACALLRKSDHSLSDIAQQCGFYDHSLLCRQFRRIVGVNPSAYRAWLQTQPGSSLVSWEAHWPL